MNNYKAVELRVKSKWSRRLVSVVRLSLPRGMRDIDAEEFSNIDYVKSRFTRTVGLFNFKMLQPSPLEMLSTLEAKGGPTISNEIYNFRDKGGREVALRFDLTVGLTRYISQRRDMKLPIKAASFGGVWRYDEPQAGRYRYFHQWDAELYDKYNLEHEAEIIQLAASFFEDLGLKVTIDISNRELLEQYMKQELGMSDPLLAFEVFRAMDKVQKKGVEAVYNEYANKISPALLKPLLELSSQIGTINEIEEHITILSRLSKWRSLSELESSLLARGVRNVRINLGIVRGLDYYSGSVFEIFDPTSKLGALAGGGRFDILTSAFDRSDIGAIGVAGGVERLLNVLCHHGLLKVKTKPLVFVASEDDDKKFVLKIVSELRGAGIPADYDSRGRSLRKQMDYGSYIGATILVRVAQKGSENDITVKNLVSGQEVKGKPIRAVELVSEII
ncbi:MAG: histidine--tRNA ligase [Nitrososphaeraceae archaeon]